jgi:hypothetical protein
VSKGIRFCATFNQRQQREKMVSQVHRIQQQHTWDGAEDEQEDRIEDEDGIRNHRHRQRGKQGVN